MNDLKLPSEWEAIDGIAVMDPDGWDRQNFAESWATPISRDEWTERMSRSTCDFSKKWAREAAEAKK